MRAATTRKDAPGSVVDRLGEPADVAHAVAWPCSEQVSCVTVTVFEVIGGAFMS